MGQEILQTYAPDAAADQADEAAGVSGKLNWPEAGYRDPAAVARRPRVPHRPFARPRAEGATAVSGLAHKLRRDAVG